MKENKNKIIRIKYDYLDSPIGTIYIASDNTGICRISLSQSDWQDYVKDKEIKKDDAEGFASKAKIQLDEYFKGIRKVFDIPISINGTEFRKKVWQSLLKIPYGEIKSYKDIAIDINCPKGVRAVGQANRANGIPIIIPCHRVVGSSGSLVGYMGNRFDLKEFLLQHEGIKI